MIPGYDDAINGNGHMDITLGYLAKAYRYSSDHINSTEYDFSNTIYSADTNSPVPDGPAYYNFLYPKNLDIIQLHHLNMEESGEFDVYTSTRPRNIALRAIIKYK